MPALTALETKARLTRMIDGFATRAGYDTEGSIAEDMTFRAWCEDLSARGMKVDRKPFSLADRAALVPLYEAIPTTRQEAQNCTLTVQKATQLGATLWEVLADLYIAKKWGPINIGLFLPDQATAGFKSEHRFMPIVRSSPDLIRDLINRVEEDGTVRRVGEGNILTRQFAQSLLMFLWTSGRVSTESRPMDVVSLDEVQEMTLAQIDKVMARMGDSLIAYAMLLSTANMPELDINHHYLMGTQEVWHTHCDRCGALSDLSDPAGIFPGRSIAFNAKGRFPGAPADDYVWCCPACEAWIKDPQVGRYVVQNPDAPRTRRSFLLPRTISPRITPRKMYEDWGNAKTGDQKKSFFNRTLARPYIDPDQIPVSLTHCEACVAEAKRLGLTWQTKGYETFMGVDQMGGFNCHIIKARLPDGRQHVVHVEATFGLQPFARTAELMNQYGVAVCVVEQLPNVNDARKLANDFPGRVFLAGYATDPKSDMVSWGDAITRSDLKTMEEDRSRWTVTLQQYKAMQNALFRVRETFCLFPDPALLEQDVLDDGVTKRIPIVRDWVFHHFTKTALVVEQHPETRAPKPRVMKVGIDPHFSYANMLCDVAWSRSHGTGSFYMPERPKPGEVETDAQRKVQEAMPGLPAAVVAMIEPAPLGTCGRCANWPRGSEAPVGLCAARELMVRRNDPQCALFEALEY